MKTLEFSLQLSPVTNQNFRRTVSMLLGALLLVASPVFAQYSETWDGGGGDDNWTTGGNWADDSAPSDPQGNVNFAGSTRLTPNNNFGSYSAGYRIFFNSGASSFTVNGNPIKFYDFGGNRARIQNDSSSAQTINFRAGAGSAAGGLDFYANSGDITYDGSTTDGGTIFLDGSSQLIVNGSSGKTVTFNKGIVDGNAAGSVAIAGPATAVYNTTGFSYTGDTFVNDGILRLAASGAASATTIRVGDTSGSASPTLQLDNGISAANTVVIRSGSSGTKTVANTSIGSGAATYSGVAYLDDSLSLSANAAGTLTLSGGVSFQNSGGGVSRTLTVSGSGNTAISGNLTNAADGNSAVSKTGSGTLTLSGGTNAQQILFNHGGGTIAISSVAHIGVPTGASYPDKFNFTDNATLQVTANSFTLGRNAGGGDNAGFRIAGSKTATFNITSGSTLTIDGVIANISGSGALAKSGTGTLQLNQANTYSGNTTISGGTLALNGSAAISSSPTITVGSGATLDLTGLSSPFTLGASQTLSGSGTVNNAAAFTVAGTVAPGASPGTLNSGSETWPGGGDYNWEINDATGTQGADPGWDLINITGGLDITATSGSKFNINVSTLTTGNVAGDAANFSSSSTYTWTILKTTQGVTNFSASVFNVDTSAFSNSIPANGTFLVELANSGLDIVLRYGLRPAVTAQPTNQTVTTGGSGSFYVTISGTATLTYQWRKSSSNLTDGANISGATTSSLTISPAALTNAGTYDVVVANDFGSITSSTATLTVNCPTISLAFANIPSTLLTTFTNPTPTTDEVFGYSVVAVGNNRVLIGAPVDDTGGSDAGAAYLFSTDGTLLTPLTKPTPVDFDNFGISVAAVGSDRVLIGAEGDDTGAADAGAAYLFSTDGTLLTTFTNPTPAVSDGFGYSVAAVGSDRVLIGAYSDDTGASGAGAAYLFDTNGTLMTTFTNPTPATLDNFGISVAAVGSDRVLIGAPQDDTGAANAGAAYLFSTNGTLLTTLTNPTPATLDNFGISVAAVGSDRVLIGAEGDDTGATDAGAAYLFSTNGTLLTTFTNPTPVAGDQFGYSVAAVGSDRVLIGAYGDDTGAVNTGTAYLFSTNGTLLATFTNPTPAAGDNFGYSVAAVGSNRLLIGAYQDDTGAGNAGTAYLFTAPDILPDGTTGVAYSHTNSASGGTAPYTYAVTGGSLPTGLSLSGGGVISGTPTAAGSFSFTFTATDAYGCMGSESYSITVVCPGITLSPPSLTNAHIGYAYSQTITASGSSGAPFSFTVTAGAVPPGFSLSGSGSLTGIPITTGDFGFTVTATDTNGCSGSKAYVIVITCPVIILSPATLPVGFTNTPYSQTITATGGIASYTFAVTGGSLPSGLSLSPAGLLSGTPTSLGSNSFNVTATDSYGCGNDVFTYTLNIIIYETDKPIVTFNSTPANNSGMTTTPTNITGTAKDLGANASGVEAVYYSLNGGPTNNPTTLSVGGGGASNWTASVAMVPGTNTVTVQAKDYAGNYSTPTTSTTRKYFLSVPGIFSLATNVAAPYGFIKTYTVTGDTTTTNGAPLKIGRAYTVEAYPAAVSNHLFTNWTVVVNGGSPTVVTNLKYTFLMNSNVSLTANFITNNFIGAAGFYYGLFNDVGVAHQSAGWFKIKTDSKQKFSGKILVQGEVVAVSGTFNQNGHGTLKPGKVFARKGLTNAPIVVELDLALDGSDVLTGTVSNNMEGWNSTLLGDRGTFAYITAPATNYMIGGTTGQFTFVYAGSLTAATEPGGDGYALVTLKSNGFVTPTGGRAGDYQLRKSTTTSISKNGQWPFYAPMYKYSAARTSPAFTAKTYRGSVFGWLTFTNNTVIGDLYWNKIDWTNGIYDSGFTNTETIIGSGYIKVTPAFAPAAMTALLADGNVPVTITNSAYLAANNYIYFTNATPPANPQGIKGKIVSAKGEFSGSFSNPVTSPALKTLIKGAVLQDINEVRGVFVGTNQTGSIRLTP